MAVYDICDATWLSQQLLCAILGFGAILDVEQLERNKGGGSKVVVPGCSKEFYNENLDLKEKSRSKLWQDCNKNSRAAFRYFQTKSNPSCSHMFPSRPLIAFQHLCLYIQKHLSQSAMYISQSVAVCGCL